MTFFTNLLETTPHFEQSILESENVLKTLPQNSARLQLLVHLAYCYAHVQLQKGAEMANEAISLADKLVDKPMKGHALCAKAMNEFRIGYLEKAKSTGREALTVFNALKDEGGIADALFHLGCMPHISVSAGDTPDYLADAIEKYIALHDETGVNMGRAQQIIHYFYVSEVKKGEHFATRFKEGEQAFKKLVNELTAPHQRHIVCFAYQQYALGLHIKEDIVGFMNTMLEWEPIAEANGNFHDVTMTKAMLPSCYRLQQSDKDVMKACLEGMEYAEKLGSIHGTCVVALIMGLMCSDQGQYDDALRYQQKANTLARDINDYYKTKLSLNAIGAVLIKLNRFDESQQAFETADREATLHKDRINQLEARRGLAELAYLRKDYDNALEALKTIIDTADYKEGWNMQDYNYYSGSIAKASEAALKKAGINKKDRNILRLLFLEKHLALAQKQQNRREEANSYNSFAVYYEETDELKRALEYRKKYIDLYTQVVNEESNKNMSKLRMHYESEKKEQEITLLKKESEQNILNERLRLSRELHDDIGSTLGSLAVYSDVAKNRSVRNENPAEALSKIGNASRDLIERMSDIVWSLNPDNEPFPQLQNRMQTFAAMMLTSRNISVDFKMDDELKSLVLTGEQRKNIFLIYKEAVYNIAKYSECKHVFIGLARSNGHMKLTIEDDGKGFDAVNTVSYNGNGIRNMKARAGDMKALLTVNSAIARGTSVELILNV